MVNTEGSELEKNGLISIYRASYNINVSIQKKEVQFFFQTLPWCHFNDH